MNAYTYPVVHCFNRYFCCEHFVRKLQQAVLTSSQNVRSKNIGCGLNNTHQDLFIHIVNFFEFTVSGLL